MKKLDEFEKICKMDNAFGYKRLGDKKQEVKIKIDKERFLTIVYEAFGNRTVSQKTLKGKTFGTKSYKEFVEEIRAVLTESGKTIDSRGIDTVKDLEYLIKEYTDPSDARELLKNFIKRNKPHKIKKQSFALIPEIYRFPGMAVSVMKNGYGVEYLVAYTETKEEGVDFSTATCIQSVEDLEAIFNA